MPLMLTEHTVLRKSRFFQFWILAPNSSPLWPRYTLQYVACSPRDSPREFKTSQMASKPCTMLMLQKPQLALMGS